jgi:hypothetical protein
MSTVQVIRSANPIAIGTGIVLSFTATGIIPIFITDTAMPETTLGP